MSADPGVWTWKSTCLKDAPLGSRRRASWRGSAAFCCASSFACTCGAYPRRRPEGNRPLPQILTESLPRTVRMLSMGADLSVGAGLRAIATNRDP